MGVSEMRHIVVLPRSSIKYERFDSKKKNAEGGVDVEIDGASSIAGFQFALSGTYDEITSCDGGVSGDAGFEVSFSDSTGTVIGFSLTGATFDCDSDCVMVSCYFSGEEGDEA